MILSLFFIAKLLVKIFISPSENGLPSKMNAQNNKILASVINCLIHEVVRDMKIGPTPESDETTENVVEDDVLSKNLYT
jgi:hypothetical protein